MIENSGGDGPVILLFNGGFGTQGFAKQMLMTFAPHFNTTVAAFKYRQSSFGGGELIDALNAFEYFNQQNRDVIFIGHSHGAYLAMLAGTKVNCTASIGLSGPYDLLEMEEFSLTHLYLPLIFSPLIKLTANECSGIPSQTPLCYKQKSPAYQTDKLNCPVMLLHGNLDNLVPVSQSIAMADALNNSGKIHELILVNTSHFGIRTDEYAWGHICSFTSQYGGLPCAELLK
ncbi:MAG: prolyl oligopeptidase family serine peptidase [Candidatus Altiarchaeota archaeon]|nr:prolyl oligopeptidase family serine peptidase [Candidatus Altiarchaeota archaeon]